MLFIDGTCAHGHNTVVATRDKTARQSTNSTTQNSTAKMHDGPRWCMGAFSAQIGVRSSVVWVMCAATEQLV